MSNGCEARRAAGAPFFLWPQGVEWGKTPSRVYRSVRAYAGLVGHVLPRPPPPQHDPAAGSAQRSKPTPLSDGAAKWNETKKENIVDLSGCLWLSPDINRITMLKQYLHMR